MVHRTAEDGSTATKWYEAYKRSYLNTETTCQENGITFIPIICEADGGGWGPAAQAVWSELAKHKSAMTGEPSSITATQLLQSLGLILHKENALFLPTFVLIYRNLLYHITKNVHLYFVH